MSNPTKIRVALLGCGQIADAHLSQIQRIRSAEVVAVCDMYEDLAYQAAARFNVPAIFTNLETMLADTKPDVVHVTTPAHTHAPLSIQLMQAGCHVYVEKPFTLDGPEAEQVLKVARKTGKQICVGHDQLFDPLWLKAKLWIKQNVIGEVRHVESILGYPISGNFGALVAANPNHSVRKLPGGLFQNTISHPLYRITDLMGDEEPTLIGGWYQRPDFDFPTELSTAFEGTTVTGSLTFSTRIPPQRITRIYGSKGTLELDFDTQTIRRSPIPTLPGVFSKLHGPWQHLNNAFWNMTHNCWRFAKSDIHYFGGMKTLFEQFYQSTTGTASPPISLREIKAVTVLMDRIFAHCRQHDMNQFHSQIQAAEAEVTCLVSP